MHPDMHYDAIVIGGGFAGLSAALQLARARRRVLVIDAGEPRNRFSEASHGFLGQDGRPPAAVLRDARKQLLVYSSAAVVDGRAVHAARHADGFTVTLASGDVYSGARLVLAMGIVDELPDIAGVRERWGRTVLHCPYCHGYEVADQRLGVLAASELSVHQALLIPDWSADVTLFTNNVVELTDDQRSALQARNVRVEERTIHSLAGTPPKLEGVVLEGGELVALDALFTSSRTRMGSAIAEQLGCAFDPGPFGPIIRTDSFKETTISGVYAAGDVARVPHNVTWASADGVTAGISAHQSLVIAKERR